MGIFSGSDDRTKAEKDLDAEQHRAYKKAGNQAAKNLRGDAGLLVHDMHNEAIIDAEKNVLLVEAVMGFFSSSDDSRRADGKPETANDKKFFDLREGGYKGPIDHNGNPVDDLDQWIKDHS